VPSPSHTGVDLTSVPLSNVVPRHGEDKSFANANENANPVFEEFEIEPIFPGESPNREKRSGRATTFSGGVT
jgi:hypothetical protein